MARFHTKTFIKHDDYMTPKYAWENISHLIPRDKIIWEAFYGDGESGKYLTELGFNVIHKPIDFFKSNEGEIIISNPPFSQSKEIMKRLKELDKPFIIISFPKIFLLKGFTNLFNDDLQIIIPRKRPTFTHLTNPKKGYTPPFGAWYYCYKMNLSKDLIFLK